MSLVVWLQVKSSEQPALGWRPGRPSLSSTHVRHVLFLSCLHLALKCVLARAHSALVLKDGTCCGRVLERKACCDDSQLPYGIWPGVASGPPWTRAKACAQTLNERL